MIVISLVFMAGISLLQGHEIGEKMVCVDNSGCYDASQPLEMFDMQSRNQVRYQLGCTCQQGQCKITGQACDTPNCITQYGTQTREMTRECVYCDANCRSNIDQLYVMLRSRDGSNIRRKPTGTTTPKPEQPKPEQPKPEPENTPSTTTKAKPEIGIPEPKPTEIPSGGIGIPEPSVPSTPQEVIYTNGPFECEPGKNPIYLTLPRQECTVEYRVCENNDVSYRTCPGNTYFDVEKKACGIIPGCGEPQ